MEQLLLAYSLPKETVAAIMMLYKNTKVKVCSPYWDTDYFDIVAGVLQGDTLAPYFFILCLDYVLRIDKTITNADYADDIALLANTPVRAETQLHSLERAAAGIGRDVNADKTEYLCNNQKGDISTLNGFYLKLVDNFTYQGNSVLSTETDINTRLAKALTAIVGYWSYGPIK